MAREDLPGFPARGSISKERAFGRQPNCAGLIYRNADPLDSDVGGSMAGFAYRCPTTGLNVQGFTANDPGDDDSYVLVTCIICTRVHLVNPRSGKVAGADDESAANT
jgi:hypothetical protein